MRAFVARGGPALPGRAALLVCLVAGGCASGPSGRVGGTEAARGGGWTRVENVPEVRQSSSDGCGAAALAMVLGHWGLDLTQDEIWAAAPPSPGQGMRAATLRDVARRQGLQAFLIEGGTADLAREVGLNRPVLVGVMKRKGRRDYPHYEVVVGIDARRQRILTLDPARGPRESSVKRFSEEWARAGRLTLVVFPRSPAPLSTAD